jgi:hypothetical protein
MELEIEYHEKSYLRTIFYRKTRIGRKTGDKKRKIIQEKYWGEIKDEVFL